MSKISISYKYFVIIDIFTTFRLLFLFSKRALRSSKHLAQIAERSRMQTIRLLLQSKLSLSLSLFAPSFIDTTSLED